MTLPTGTLKWSGLVLAGVVLVAAGGFAALFYTRDLPGTKTYGRIFIDSPEVYTRERLVNDRFVQDAWLRAQLQTLDTATFGRDETSTSSSTVRVWLGERTSSGNATVGANPVAPETAASSGFLEATNTYRLHNTLREQIRQDIIENQLDDRHDLAGNKLYMLKFDASVIPGENTTDSAIVEIDAGPLTTESSGAGQSWQEEINEFNAGRWREFYAQWLRDLESRLNDRMARTFESISSARASERLIVDFLNFYDTYVSRAPSDVELSDQIRAISEAVRRPALLQPVISVLSQSAAPRDRFLDLTSNPMTWRKLRPAANMFVVQEAVHAIIGTTIEPRYWLGNSIEGFEQTVNSATERSEFFDLRNLTGELTFELDLDQPLFDAKLIQPTSPRGAPRVNLSEKKLVFWAFDAGCFENLNTALAQDWFFDSGSYVGPADDGPGRQMGMILRFPPHWDLRGERHYAMWQPPRAYTNPTYLGKALGDPTKRAPAELALFLQSYSEDGDAKIEVFIGDEFKARRSDRPAVAAPPFTRRSAEARILFSKCFRPLPEPPPAVTGQLNIGFIAFASELTRESAYSYAVLPRYDAAIEELRDERDIGLAAQLPTGPLSDAMGRIGGEAASRSAYSGVRARTNLVGFGTEVRERCKDEAADSERCHARMPRFGWVISPKHQDLGLGAARMSATQRSLAALVSVPAWWEQLELRVRVGWMDREGTVRWVDETGHFFDLAGPGGEDVKSLDETTGEEGSSATAFEYSVVLPRDLEAVDDIVFNRHRRGPQISVLEIEEGSLTIPPCASFSLEIPGQRLWRSAVVTLAGRTAQKIEVLPNMRGIIATFAPFSEEVKGAILTVWTSEGSAQYPRSISVPKLPEGKTCGT